MRALILPIALLTLLAVSETSLADSSGPTLNPYRAYPPSCLALPFPAPSGPTSTARVTVETVNSAFQPVGTETVNFVFWRTPCSGGKSALLGEMYRDAAFQNTLPVPVLGGIEGSQGAIQGHAMRIVAEPNTALSYLPVDQIVLSQLTFVFENDASAVFDFSQPITISINSIPSPVAGTIPAYDPNQYADASQPMQISGYLSGNWDDPTHSGEGVQTEIGEITGTTSRYIVFAWYTYDATGTPYWLFGSGGFTAGDRSASFQLAYVTGGGFAGNFGASAHPQLWGNVTVDFPDCNTMAFSYAAASGLPSSVPQGSGTKQWTRVTSINGATCQ